MKPEYKKVMIFVMLLASLFFARSINVFAQVNSPETNNKIDFEGIAIFQTIIGYSFADVGGNYYIQSNYSSKYIDIHGPSTLSGTLIHEWVYHPDLQENWFISKLEDGYYCIKSVYSNKYIGVDSQNTGINKNNIKQFTTLNDYTKWVIYVDNEGKYIIKPKLWNYQYLASPVNSSVDELQLSNSLTSTATKWTFYKQEDVSNGTYFMQNIDTRKYADLYGPLVDAGTIIHQWDLNASNLSTISSWRQWEIIKGSDLYYTIKNIYSGKYMGYDTSTWAIKQYSSVSDNTKWKIYSINTISVELDGTDTSVTEYIFVPKGSSFSPYSYSIGVSDGTNVNGRALTLKSVSESRISWDLADATLTYLTRIYNWDYQDTRFSYAFGYFEPEYYVYGVGRRNIDLYIYNHDVLSDPAFSTAFTAAIPYSTNQWDNALNPFINNFQTTPYETSADIRIYGGTIEDLGYDSVPGAGVCGVVSSNLVGFVIYGNEILKVFEYHQMYIDIINYAENEDQFGMNVVLTHEMGHALGFAGHSYNDIGGIENYAVMNGTYSTSILQNDEKAHLYQIWDHIYD
jgi:hypothetical protein